MKKTITIIMTLVLAVTALGGCTDEYQSSTSVSDKSSDVSAAAATPPTSAEDKDVTENLNDTDDTENSVEPEDTEDTESSNTNSEIDLAVKQLALQELTAIKDNDLEKYLELTNIDNFSSETIMNTSLPELREYIKKTFYDAQKVNWSDTDITDFKLKGLMADHVDNEQTEYYVYVINWDNEYYSAEFQIFSNTNGEYMTFIEDIDTAENAVNANSAARVLYTAIMSYCEEQEITLEFDTTKLTGSYYIGPDAQYDNDVMTNFVEEWLPDYCNIENVTGLLYIQMGDNGFPALVQWTKSEDSTVIGQYPNADENGDVEFLW